MFSKAQDIPVEDAKLFREIFDSFDKNHDGLISTAEFNELFKKKNFTKEQINLFVSKKVNFVQNNFGLTGFVQVSFGETGLEGFH